MSKATLHRHTSGLPSAADLGAPVRVHWDSYKDLIKTLLDATAALDKTTTSTELRAARRRYFQVAVAKGVALAPLPAQIAALNQDALMAAAKALPDKPVRGNSAFSYSIRDRMGFAAASERRSDDMRWDDLFDNKNDLYLPVERESSYYANKIQPFLDTHNAQAKINFAIAAERDDPRHPLVGRTIEQQLIRRDPEDPSRLQVYRPNKKSTTPNWNPEEKDWRPGPKLGNYLRDEWELYDIAQREADALAKEKLQPAKAEEDVEGDLLSIAHFGPVDADALLRKGKLGIVVSRDPQKIAEMSCQRWKSCMSKGGVNHHYVEHDIEEGTLVVYVVLKDDVDARWPLMRLLLKPYRNDKGDTVLAPGRIYGGEANPETRQALLQAAMDFCAEANKDKHGLYRMEPTLYGDGQATTINLADDWTTKTLHEAIESFQRSSLQEDLTEIHKAIRILDEDPFDKEARERYRTLANTLRRIFDLKDHANGLARTFFREMIKTATGVAPKPTEIIAAIETYAPGKKYVDALDALSCGDVGQWRETSKHWSDRERFLLLNLAGITITAKNDTGLYATTNAILDACADSAPTKMQRTGKRGLFGFRSSANEVTKSIKELLSNRLDSLLDTVKLYATTERGGNQQLCLLSEVLAKTSGVASPSFVMKLADNILHGRMEWQTPDVRTLMCAALKSQPGCIPSVMDLIRPCLRDDVGNPLQSNSLQLLASVVRANPLAIDEATIKQVITLRSKSQWDTPADEALRCILGGNSVARDVFVQASLPLLKHPNVELCAEAARMMRDFLKTYFENATPELLQALLDAHCTTDHYDVRSATEDAIGHLIDHRKDLATPQTYDFLKKVDLCKDFDTARHLSLRRAMTVARIDEATQSTADDYIDIVLQHDSSTWDADERLRALLDLANRRRNLGAYVIERLNKTLRSGSPDEIRRSFNALYHINNYLPDIVPDDVLLNVKECLSVPEMYNNVVNIIRSLASQQRFDIIDRGVLKILETNLHQVYSDTELETFTDVLQYKPEMLDLDDMYKLGKKYATSRFPPTSAAAVTLLGEVGARRPDKKGENLIAFLKSVEKYSESEHDYSASPAAIERVEKGRAEAQMPTSLVRALAWQRRFSDDSLSLA